MNLNLNNHKIWAIIPAAGSGRRFSQSDLKQYQTIQHKTVIEHTVARLTELPLSGYVLAISATDTYAATLDFPQKDKLHFCPGGAERVDSVLNGLRYLQQIASPDDWVLVHDAARPCVGREQLLDLLQHAIIQDCNAILATPVRDTLKRVAQQPQITETVDRSTLWQAQTPQLSKIKLLAHAIENALQDGMTITDEASALEYAGLRVDVVAGRADNIKITYPEDLEMARMILAAQGSI